MKKVVLVLAAVAVVATMASCKKTCTCKSYAAGVEVMSTEVDLSTVDAKKCADMTTVADIPGVGKTGMECK